MKDAVKKMDNFIADKFSLKKEKTKPKIDCWSSLTDLVQNEANMRKMKEMLEPISEDSKEY